MSNNKCPTTPVSSPQRVSPTLNRDAGATSVEYALMVTLIAAVIVGSVTSFGIAVSDLLVVPCQALGGCASAMLALP
jgi:Flp pilus assembly pilin Flp